MSVLFPFTVTEGKWFVFKDLICCCFCLAQDKFFCKVHDILHKHEHFAKGKEQKEEKDIVRNLDVYIRDRNVSLPSDMSSN